MAKGINKNSIVIPRKEIQKKGGVVILPLKEYLELYKRTVPTYYLTGKEAKELDKLVEEGLKDYALGKTREIESLKDLG